MGEVLENRLSKMHYLLSEALDVWESLPSVDRLKLEEETGSQLTDSLNGAVSMANDMRSYLENK